MLVFSLSYVMTELFIFEAGNRFKGPAFEFSKYVPYFLTWG